MKSAEAALSWMAFFLLKNVKGIKKMALKAFFTGPFHF